ncbi:hypothetical protein WMW72_34325 [Paenibacillus filicis]|uniref:Uncharacterized protein n=1 Tax=Paenibacillus filicis TaxID=669464 RepID=A0ABU9DVS7_9BACL
MKAHVFVDDGVGLNEEQAGLLSGYESYITFEVPLVVNFDDLTELSNNLDLKQGVDYIFGCSNIKFINFFMLKLAKEAGRQNMSARFINLEHAPIDVYSFVYDDSNEQWLLVR